MKLATLLDGTRDGRLIVVDRLGRRYLPATDVAPTLQAALDDWEGVEGALRALSGSLEREPTSGTAVRFDELGPPLPRAYEWVDGSAFLTHVVRARKARGAEPPATLKSEPLVYQGGSGVLLAPRAPMVLPDVSWGLDFEGEICTVLSDTPRATKAADAGRYIRLFMLANDITYRVLVPPELDKGFGFFCSKPATAFSPFAVTPDELGGAFVNGRVHRPLQCYLNDVRMGDPDAGEMYFSFFDLIAHITKTRAFTAGTILGSGTVSNESEARGVTCLAELRARETIARGAPSTPFLKAGDRVRIAMVDDAGVSIFGDIVQEVTSA